MIELSESELSLLTPEQRETYYLDRALERRESERKVKEIQAKMDLDSKRTEIDSKLDGLVHGKHWSEQGKDRAIIETLQEKSRLEREYAGRNS